MAVDIGELIRSGLPGSEVIVEGEDGRHFEATIISDAFSNKKSIERQRIIYALIGKHITSGAIHALSLKTFTPQEWQEQCDN